MKRKLELQLLPRAERIKLLEEKGKQPKTIEQQIDILKSRKMIIVDDTFAKHLLADVNYYRLTGYTFPYKTNDVYNEDFSIENAYGLYELDDHIRNLLFSLIGRFEIRLKTQFAYVMSLEHGSAAHLKEELYSSNHFSFSRYIKEYEHILSQKYSSDLQFVRWNIDTYSELPIWAAVEVLSFGTVSKLYSAIIDKEAKEAIAKSFHTHQAKSGRVFHLSTHTLISWSRSLCYIRNLCAHHERLFRRSFKISPTLFRDSKGIDNGSIFGALIKIS